MDPDLAAVQADLEDLDLGALEGQVVVQACLAGLMDLADHGDRDGMADQAGTAGLVGMAVPDGTVAQAGGADIHGGGAAAAGLGGCNRKHAKHLKVFSVLFSEIYIIWQAAHQLAYIHILSIVSQAWPPAIPPTYAAAPLHLLQASHRNHAAAQLHPA